MFRLIFYVVIFYFIVKVFSAFSRWLTSPDSKSRSSSVHTRNYADLSKYNNVEEAEFTEIKADSKKEKAD